MRRAPLVAGLLLAVAPVFADTAPSADPFSAAGKLDTCSQDFVTHYYKGSQTAMGRAAQQVDQFWHPMEVSLIKDIGLAALADPQITKSFDSKTPNDVASKITAAMAAYQGADAKTGQAKTAALAHANALASAAIAQLRPQLQALAQKRGAGGADASQKADQFDAFDARFLACRYGQLGLLPNLRQALQAKSASPDVYAASLEKWRQFVRTELTTYAAESQSLDAKTPVDYNKLYTDGMAKRAKAFLNDFAGRTAPALTQQPQAPAAADVNLTPQERDALPNKLLADYLAAQAGDMKKYPDPGQAAQLNAALKADADRYRKIIKMAQGLKPQDQTAFLAAVDGTTTPQQRDDVVTQYNAKSSAKQDLSLHPVTDQGPGKFAKTKDLLTDVSQTCADKLDGRGCQSGSSYVVSGSCPTATDAENIARARRNAAHAANFAVDGSTVPSPDADPNADNPDADAKKTANLRDSLAGAKFGLGSAILGLLLFGPVGLVLLGAVGFAAGFVMNRISSDGHL